MLLTRSGTAPSRQQTVLATIQWSWNHLLEPEQDLLRKLALFPGGWTLELATSVCSANGDEFEVLDLLTRLAERSLVVVQRGSRVRYRFLESVWRFALDRLQEDPDRGAAEERFVTTYAEFCKDMRNRLDSGMDVMEQLRAEEENALAAITLSDGMSGGSDRACEIASGLYRVWAMSGRFAFGRRIMEDILEREQPGTLSAARQDTLVRLGGFHLTMGAIDEARAELEEALEISGQLGLSNAAVIAGLGTVSIFQGRWEDALSYGEEAVAIYRKSGRKRGIAMGLHNIAFIEFTLQRPGYGTEKFEKALALFRELGDEITESLTLSSLAAARLCCGRPPETCGLLLRALDIAERQRTVRETMFIIEGASELLLERQRPSEAARLAGGAENLRLSAQIAIGPGEVPAEARLDKIRRQLPDSAADKAFAEGQTLSFEDLIRETRQLLLTIEERGSPKPDGESRTP